MYAPEKSLAMSASNMDNGRMAKALHDKLENAENENLNLQEQLLESTEKQSELAIENDRLHKKITALQQDLSIYINNQARLEEDHYTQNQELTGLRKEVTQLTKEKNILQKKLKTELDTSENNQLKWQQREEELCKQVRQLTENERSHHKNKTSARRSSSNNNSSKKKQGQAAHNKEQQKSTDVSCPSPNPSSSPSPRRTCSTRSSYERQVTDLKQQLKSQEARFVKEMSEQDRRQSKRIRSLETEISNMKHINQSLMEENEGYQILLNERAMNGSLLHSDSQREMANNSITETATSGINLAAELHNVSSHNIHDSDGGAKMQRQQQTNTELHNEIKSLKDSNHALNLYLNKILAKIIDNEDLEYLLSVDHQHSSMSTPTSQQMDNSKITTSSKVSLFNRVQDGPPVMRKSFSSTMLSKILRRKQHNDQQISLNTQDPAIPPRKTSNNQSPSSTSVKQPTNTTTATTFTNTTIHNLDLSSWQQQKVHLKKQRISIDLEDNSKRNSREKITNRS